ncbi:MAG: V-type ATP synthase subunit I [Lachnospiraceae bacterium]|nr:V-type ATP synthase subunit I [Lachnospiraceae bacterium]
MSVVPMKRVMICALKKDRKAILEYLQRQGVMEIRAFMEEDDTFRRQDTESARQLFMKNSELAAQALSILDKHSQEEKGLLSSLEGRKSISAEEYYERLEDRDEVLGICREIVSLEKQYADDKAQVPKLELEKISLAPWLSYDMPIDFEGTKQVAAMAGTFPGALTKEEILAQLSENTEGLEAVDAEVISSDKEQTCVLILCLRESEETVREALRKMNFAKPPLSDKNPAKEIEAIERKIDALTADAADVDKKLSMLGSERSRIRFMQDYFGMRGEKYEALGELGQSDNVFVLNGYMPASEAARIEKELTEKYDIVYETADPAPDEDVPVLLKNGPLAQPLESVVESYALPGRGERDPSSLVAVFYYILFGIMLGDAGYGLILMLFTGIALKKCRDMEPGTKGMMQMLFYCGISTTIMGFVFGSFFGDAVSVIASTFFGRDDIAFKALWFEPIDKPMKMMVFSFALGIIHIFTGLGAKLYADIKDGHVMDGIYDVVTWYLLVGGAIVYMLTSKTMTDMLGLSFTLPAAVGKIAVGCVIAGAAGIVLMSGRSSRSIGKRAAKGLYNLYGATSYLSDILSYSRLLALGLAATVISSVFNLLAGMLGKGHGVIGVVLFIVIFLIGHILNFAINALGAYVHTNRLTYVEFFGKFYDGGGRRFEPFRLNTKYYKVRE